jgi:transcriptional regulator NrdR family protein
VIIPPDLSVADRLENSSARLSGVFDCPHCQRTTASEVVDSRHRQGVVRRRRMCLVCRQRYTTYERAIDPLLFEQQRDRAKAIAAKLRDMAAALEVW